MQVKSLKYMLQTRGNYGNIQEPTNKQNLEDISQYETSDRICHLPYGLYNMQPTVCQLKWDTIQH